MRQTQTLSPLALIAPRTSAARARVRPGGLLNPMARGIVVSGMPTDIDTVLVDGVPTPPDSDSFIAIPTSGNTRVTLASEREVRSFSVRLLEPSPRVVPYEEIPLTWLDGAERVPEGRGRLELVGVPTDAVVQVWLNTNTSPGEETMTAAVDAPNVPVPARWNADRTTRSVFVPSGAPHTLRVLDSSGRQVFRSSFDLAPGEVRDVILGYLRLGSAEPTVAPTAAPDGTPSPSPSGTGGPSTSPTPTPTGAQGTVGYISLSVSPRTASVMINGAVVGGDRLASLAYAPGTYAIDVAADGYEKHRETVTVLAGRTANVAINLAPTGAKGGAGWSRGKIALVAAAALGAVGLAVGGVVYASRRAEARAKPPVALNPGGANYRMQILVYESQSLRGNQWVRCFRWTTWEIGTHEKMRAAADAFVRNDQSIAVRVVSEDEFQNGHLETTRDVAGMSYPSR